MEPAKPKIHNIFCPIHDDVIRKVAINDKNEVSLLCAECIDCMEGNQKPERYIIETYLAKIAQSYSLIPKLQQLPDSTIQILNTENEMVANFTHHIEQEKEKVNNMIDKLRQSVYQKLEMKKRQLIANLDAQVKSFEDVLTYYKQKMYHYKEGQEIVPSFESLYKEVIKMNHATELKKYLQLHYENMKNSEVFAQIKEEKAKKLLTDAIKAMESDLMNAQLIKPTICFEGNNENLEELLKKWSEQVESTINGLKIEVKDPVKPITFHFQNSMDFDSVILDNSIENKKMVATWVFETLKANQGPFKLLYRGSRDGFSTKNFHEKCDNKGPTVMIIKSNYGKVFGGFTDISWDSSNSWKTTKNAFLFSVDKKGKYTIKPDCEGFAMRCHENYGPSFGNGHDLYISDKCNTNHSSYSNFPYSFVCNEYINQGHSDYLAGAYTFTVAEIEVYSV